MTSRTFMILCPNGRRQQLKATTNTTNLQILEDVCTKQGLNSDQFDLKHYNQILDLTNTVQFSNLPNNAQLELVETTKPRKEQMVNIALQLEEGQRFIQMFTSSCTLWDVINQFHPREMWLDTNKIPVCIYMRREISGEEMLSKTTLRGLGLVSGSGVIRLIFRSNSYESLTTKQQLPRESDLVTQTPTSTKTETKIDVPQPLPSPKINRNLSVDLNRAEIKQETGFKSLSSIEMELQLDKRKAYIFSLDDIEHVPSFDELPEGFFDLTVEDVRVLMADLKKQRLVLENKVLQTSAMREAQMKRKIEKYPNTVIRIFFPDRLVLQGNFKATETVGDVMAFVLHFLRDQTINFYLFTTPPKRKLNPQLQLFSENLVPGANVYFGTDSPFTTLRPEIYNLIVSPNDANREAVLPRVEANTAEPTQDITMEDESQLPSTSNAGFVPQESANVIRQNSVPPKWLKIGKK